MLGRSPRAALCGVRSLLTALTGSASGGKRRPSTPGSDHSVPSLASQNPPPPRPRPFPLRCFPRRVLLAGPSPSETVLSVGEDAVLLASWSAVALPG